MLSPHRLMLLSTVHERGGVVAAAESLHLTASAVSQQLRALEAEAGVPLLDRSGRGIRLTRAGLQMADRGRRIADEVIRAGDDLAPWTDPEGQVLTIGSFQTAIRQLFAPLVAEDALGHLGVRMRIIEIEGADAFRELHAGTLDLVMEEAHAGDGPLVPDGPWGQQRGRGVGPRLVIEDRYVIVVPQDWPSDTTPDELRTMLMQRQWVAQSAIGAAGETLQVLQERWGFEADVVHVFANYESAVALVRAGAGATLAPALALPVVEDLGGVRMLTGSPDLGARRVTAWARTARRPVPAVEALLDVLHARTSAIGLQAERLAPAPQD